MERLACALILTAALAVCGCGKSGERDAESACHHGPAVAVARPDSDFPATGLRAIFRSDYPFVAMEGDVSPISAPPTRPGRGARLLCEGEDLLKWRLDLVKRSRRSVRIQSFIFTAVAAGKLLAEALKDRRGAGHDVRVTINTYTRLMPADRLLYNDLELHGIKVMGDEPVYLLGTSGDKFKPIFEKAIEDWY